MIYLIYKYTKEEYVYLERIFSFLQIDKYVLLACTEKFVIFKFKACNIEM